jgi:hypothetical protein
MKTFRIVLPVSRKIALFYSLFETEKYKKLQEFNSISIFEIVAVSETPLTVERPSILTVAFEAIQNLKLKRLSADQTL